MWEGVGSRTTTDFELDSDRAWNSILDSAGRIEQNSNSFHLSEFGRRAGNVPRLPHFYGVGNSRRVRFCFTQYMKIVPPDSIRYNFFQPARNCYQRNLEAPIHFEKLLV